MKEIDTLIKELADSPDDFDRQAGKILFLRQGREFELNLKDLPGCGLVVMVDNESKQPEPVPFEEYIQGTVLELPRLATQIIKVMDLAAKARPAPFIEGPSELVIAYDHQNLDETGNALLNILREPEVGTTTLIQLMAGAGQGKTILLENLAKRSCQQYRPVSHPIPIILSVDLLGRYVGTVDDAIAGSLNNTYRFLNLSQRDVALCMRQRWIILALDGFDELVARIGVRDAFARITELLDQLENSGTVVLSARETFFELHQISAAIRSYLQPKVGSYSTKMIRLLPWTEKQATSVFRLLGSTDPSKDLADLLGSFQDDRSVVLQPFFMTRLADLWMKGERFAQAAADLTRQGRTKYIIERYVDREVTEKWVDRDRKPILTGDGHSALLGGIAEEMWRSSTTKLSHEDLRLACLLSLENMKLPVAQQEIILDRIPTHCVFTAKEGRYTFVHDRFLQYYLARQLSIYLLHGNADNVRDILCLKDIGPEIVDWVVWMLGAEIDSQEAGLACLMDMMKGREDKLAADNASRLIAGLLDGYFKGFTVQKLEFSGECLAGRNFRNIQFADCDFWYVNICNSVFQECKFVRCKLSSLQMNKRTLLTDTVFDESQALAVEREEDGQALFDPIEVENALKQRGAIFPLREETRPLPPPRVLSQDVKSCVRKLVKASETSCDIVIEEMEERLGNIARIVTKAAIKCGVLRSVTRDASGPRKTFVRFKVDRELLLRGECVKTGTREIDDFWDSLMRNK
jgi:hypothetical protein